MPNSVHHLSGIKQLETEVTLPTNNIQLPEKLKLSFLLADVYISLYMFLHFYICLCVFAYFVCVFVYILDFLHMKVIV